MLGDVLRDARKSKKLTLSELAEKVGVTTGYLSHLERNKMEPSLSVLRSLSDELSIPVSMLFVDDDSEDIVVVRKNQRAKVSYLNLSGNCQVLTPLVWRSTTPPDLEVLQVTIPPESRISGENISHHTDECIYVLSGELEYHYGDACIRIETGGSIYIPKKTGHYIYNYGDSDAMIIWVVKSETGGNEDE